MYVTLQVVCRTPDEMRRVGELLTAFDEERHADVMAIGEGADEPPPPQPLAGISAGKYRDLAKTTRARRAAAYAEAAADQGFVEEMNALAPPPVVSSTVVSIGGTGSGGVLAPPSEKIAAELPVPTEARVVAAFRLFAATATLPQVTELFKKFDVSRVGELKDTQRAAFLTEIQ